MEPPKKEQSWNGNQVSGVGMQQPILKPIKWQDMADMSENPQQTNPQQSIASVPCSKQVGNKWSAMQKKKSQMLPERLCYQKSVPPTKWYMYTCVNFVKTYLDKWCIFTYLSTKWFLDISSHHILTIWQGFIYKKNRPITFRGIRGDLL